MEGKIRAEWDHLKKVVIHRPGFEMFFGLLDPVSSLYERAFSRSGARHEHEMLETVLKNEFNIEVLRLKETILDAADKDPQVLKELVDLAREIIVPQGDPASVEKARKEFDNNVKYLDAQHFFNILIMNPGIEYAWQGEEMQTTLNISKRTPLCNLYFMRDQQFVTDQGIVMSRLASPVRRPETNVTRFLWKNVFKLPVALEIKDPGTIEGGEFIPMGKFALVGVGSRTNQSAIDQLMTVNFDFEELAVVHQPMHPLVSAEEPDPMINMHLDTYFNVAASDVVVGCELLLKNAQVDIYRNEGNGFVKEKKQITLYEYITKKGFHVINITSLEQMSYASNFLCIKNKEVLAIEVERIVTDVLANLELKAKSDSKRYGKLYAQAKKDYEHLRNDGQFFPHKKEVYRAGIDAYPVILKNLTGGYGGAHCMTCAVTRT